MTWRRWLAVCAVALCAPALVGFDLFHAPDPDVVDGNRAYSAGDWDAAIAAYERALERRSGDDGVEF
ncbi:MAG: hypothetical protein D6689_19705, partial [Deltaproteobacteria bacterium]